MTTIEILKRAYDASGGDYHRALDYSGNLRVGSNAKIARRAYNALYKAAKEFRAAHTGRNLSPCRNLRWSLDGTRIVCSEIDEASNTTSHQNDEGAPFVPARLQGGKQ